jgi:hypothetical protein
VVWSRVRPSFLAAVCGFLVGGVSLARAEPMGDLGGADRLVVRGPSAETAASLRKGLLNDGDLYWLGIPTADREPYLAALRTRVPLALEAAGFPEPRATVTVGPGPDGMEAVLIDIVAGERLTAGAIRVTGIPDDVARRLVAYLQQPQPPGDAVPETITLPDGSEKVLWFDAKGEPAKLGRPKWTPGEPAPCGERCASELLGAVAGFFSGEGYLSLDGWKDSWEEGYLDAIREHVDLEVRAEGDEAVLAIDVKRLPARTTLVGIEVNDGLRKTPADLLAYLGLTVGQPVTAADRQAWLGKLRLSGRFIKQACRFEPGGDGCVARFDLVEYKRAAPLDRGVSPEQQALLRARAWLLGEWHAGREIRVRATIQREDKAKGPWRESLELITGRETGSVVKLASSDWSCALACVQGMAGLFTDTSRFEGSFVADWAPGATLKLFVDPRDQKQRLEVGWGMRSGGSARCAFQIEPVTCNAEGWTSRRVGDDLVIETTDADGHQELWLDPASGRPRKLVYVAESNRAEILCDSGAGLVAAAVADLRERAGENLADSHRPLSSAARFALANRSLFGDALWLATAKTTGTELDDDAIARWIESLQAAVDGDGFAAIDATVAKGIRQLRDAVATDTPEGLAIPVSTAEEMAGLRAMMASRSAGMTAAIDGVPVARDADDRIPPPLAGPSREPWMGRALGRKCAAAAAPALRMLEQKTGRDAAAVAAARAAVLMVCTADQAAAARELARMPAASLWTPELESLCAAFGPQGRNLDRRAREALAYLHGVAGDTAWSVAAYRRLLAETEEQHGPDHREMAKYLHNLVWLLNQSGDVTEAYALARRPRATIAWESGLHPPVPARLKRPPDVAKQGDAKVKGPDAGKADPRKANGSPSDSSPAADFERWSGLQLGTPGARR